MKLILTRHAKSSWDDFSLDDHDRPLNSRGQNSAQNMGKWVFEKGYVPAQIACSTARRAQETWEGMSQALPDAPVTLEEGLYHASSDRILRQIQKSPPGDLLIIGHNPGFAEAAAQLVKTRPSHPDFGRFPTCATAIFEVEIDTWRDIRWQSGTLIDFMIPRELTN